MNDCDPTASCMDHAAGYECLCREGFLDVSDDPLAKPGRKCLKLINECSTATMNNCDKNAKCLDRPVGYTCRCNPGFVDISTGGARRPGRNCTKGEFVQKGTRLKWVPESRSGVYVTANDGLRHGF